MFYLSSISHNYPEVKYGITDTVDNVTEFYTKVEVLEILKKIGFTSIKGVVFTGSDLKFRRTSPVIEYINSLQNGSFFTLVYNSVETVEYKKLSTLGALNGWVVEENGIRHRLTTDKILSNKVTLG